MTLEKKQKYDNLLNNIIKKIYKVYPFINAYKNYRYCARAIEINIIFFYKSELYEIVQYIPLNELNNVKEFEFIENYILHEIIHKIQEIILKDNEILRKMEIYGGE